MGYHDVAAALHASEALKDAAVRAGIEPEQAGAILQGLFDHAAAGKGVEGALEGIAEAAALLPSQVQQFLPLVPGLLQSRLQGAVNVEGEAETPLIVNPLADLVSRPAGRRTRRLFGLKTD
jgi:hypothetical protein